MSQTTNQIWFEFNMFNTGIMIIMVVFIWLVIGIIMNFHMVLRGFFLYGFIWFGNRDNNCIMRSTAQSLIIME